MRVANWAIEEQSGTVEVSADIDGFRLWYRVPSHYGVSRSGDVFLASSLLPAMRQGSTLEIDSSMPVSPKLLTNAALLQDIFHSWNPKQLKIIPLVANSSVSSPDEPINTGVASFFSGGVDSTYTLLKHEDEISHLVFIQGFDFYENRGADSALSVSDLADLSGFSYHLMAPSNGLYAFVKSQLSQATKQALTTYLKTSSMPQALDTVLVDDLNSIIAGELIYDPNRFQGVNLRPETKRLLAQERSGDITKDLNRMLLEDACRGLSRKGGSIYSTAIERNRKFSKNVGKVLIPVETNHFPFGYRYNLSRNLSHGSCLGSVALLLGFSRMYVPASYSYSQLFPLGSHPLTDPLWSNERTDMVHDGCEAGRTDKLKKIYRNGTALANLRVCFGDMNENCGNCLKCRRTMIALKLLNAPNSPFPALPSLRSIKKAQISDEVKMVFFKENVDLALHSTDNEALKNALQTCLRRKELRRLFGEFQKLAMGDVVKQVYRKVTKWRPGFRRIDTTPPGE
jgi:7-cyano-7-deazaguanine synthase in queuosine biosynthesis